MWPTRHERQKGAVGSTTTRPGRSSASSPPPPTTPLTRRTSRRATPSMKGSTSTASSPASSLRDRSSRTVTLSAAIETLPDLFDRTFTCTGSLQVGDELVTCPMAHGEMDIYSAYTQSCNGVLCPAGQRAGGRRPLPLYPAGRPHRQLPGQRPADGGRELPL